MTNKVDDATIAELRRLTSAPGHDRMGMMAKGCMKDLLDELESLRSQNSMTEGQKAVAKLDEPAPVITSKEEPFYKKDKGKSYSTYDRKDALAEALGLDPDLFPEDEDLDK